MSNDKRFKIGKFIKKIREKKKESMRKCIGLLLDVLSKVKTDKCCVCYEETKWISKCGHVLCKSCYNGILNSNLNYCCPICRSEDFEPGLNIKGYDSKLENIFDSFNLKTVSESMVAMVKYFREEKMFK